MAELANIRFSVNKKKPLRLLNPSLYFRPEKDKLFLTVQSPESYSAYKSKVEGYETRLYYEYKYCEEHNGQTFFFTLTYCDAKVPKYLGQNVFDYNDLVWLLNGAFKKQLIRKYGTNFKYFVGAELGEGAGERGLHNNPHYHILFFLRPSEKSKVPYKKIDPLEFRSLLRHYWQGFDEDIDGFTPYQDCKYGIVKEGRYGIKVDGFRALHYCAKYCTKDIQLRRHEKAVFNALYKRFSEFYNIDNRQLVRQFLQKNCKNLTDYQLNRLEDDSMPFDDMMLFVESNGLQKALDVYIENRVLELVKIGMLQYRNRFTNKCRISHGVGDYALEHIDDRMFPKIKIPTKKGFVCRTPSVYYYRKMFTEVVKADNGNNIRILNSEGLRYQSRNLSNRINKLANKTYSEVSVLDSSLYDKLLRSDVNIDVTMSYCDYVKLLNNFQLYEVCKRYAEYKLIYENRFAEFCSYRGNSTVVFDYIKPLLDYRKFIEPSYNLGFGMFPGYARSCLETTPEGFISYNSHPYFLPYLRLFSVFGLLSDYLFVQSDDKAEYEALEREKVRKYHVIRNLNGY